ncbi:MAG: hypothetical protein J6A28_03435 [Clostridia bacterium]|nr:hypothetical protein [Clostridia bacterium]
MLNILIPVTKGFEKYHKTLEVLADAYDIKVFLGLESQIYQSALAQYGNVSNFDLFEFDDGTDKEEMLNALQDYLTSGQILILRKPISEKEFEKIIKSDRDVVTAKVARSGFKSFMFRLWQNITKLLLGVKMYAGDTSVIYFNSDISDVVLNSSNLSYSSRVNRWKGIRQSVVTCEAENDIKQIDRQMTAKNTIIASILVSIGAVVTTLVSIFVPMTVLIAMLLVALDGICVAVAFILVVMLIFTNMTGKKQQRKAIILNDNIEDGEE